MRSKARVCGCLLAGLTGLNPAGGHGCLSLVSTECCQVGVSASAYHSSRVLLLSVACLSGSDPKTSTFEEA